MKSALRFVVLGLMVAGTVSAAAFPKHTQTPQTQVLQGAGGSPMPTCDPWGSDGPCQLIPKAK